MVKRSHTLLLTEFYQKDRLSELFITGSQIMKLPAITRSAQWLRVEPRVYLKHDFFQYVIRPSQAHHQLHLRFNVNSDYFGLLTINRPQGEADFNSAELDTLQRLLPFMTHAFKDSDFPVSNSWMDAESGLILFDANGRIMHMDEIAEKILDYALERRQQNRPHWRVPRIDPLLPDILKTMTMNLHAIASGKANAEPPHIRRCNRWGHFEFRGRCLPAMCSDTDPIFVATVQRLVPLPLKLALNLKRHTLSVREAQVALAEALGETHAKIAQKLYISERTVIGHTRKIYDKLEVTNRTELLTKLINIR